MRRQSADVEDNQSVGLLFTFGRFRMLYLADLEADTNPPPDFIANLKSQKIVYPGETCSG